MQVKILDIHHENLGNMCPTNALAGYSFFYNVYDKGIFDGQNKQDAFEAARKFLNKGMSLHDVVDTLQLSDAGVTQLREVVV